MSIHSQVSNFFCDFYAFSHMRHQLLKKLTGGQATLHLEAENHDGFAVLPNILSAEEYGLEHHEMSAALFSKLSTTLVDFYDINLIVYYLIKVKDFLRQDLILMHTTPEEIPHSLQANRILFDRVCDLLQSPELIHAGPRPSNPSQRNIVEINRTWRESHRNMTSQFDASQQNEVKTPDPDLENKTSPRSYSKP